MTAVPAFLIAAFAPFAATPCLAALDAYKDWKSSPESVYLATSDERNEWKKIASEGEAQKFVALFWARRDPDLKTPANEFRARFDALVKKADDLFALGGKRGALTERGKAFILIGPPKSIARNAVSELPPNAEIRAKDPSDSSPLGDSASGLATQGSLQGTGVLKPGAGTILTRFVYEKEQLPPWADTQSLELRFEVNIRDRRESLVDTERARRLEAKAAHAALVNPQLKEVPAY